MSTGSTAHGRFLVLKSIVQSRRCACFQGTHSMTLKRLLQRTKVAHSGHRSRHGGPTSQGLVPNSPRQSSHYEQRGGNIGEGRCGMLRQHHMELKGGEMGCTCQSKHGFRPLVNQQSLLHPHRSCDSLIWQNLCRM